MSETTSIQFKRNKLSDSNIDNVVLDRGEPCFKSTTNELFIGDGESQVNQLNSFKSVSATADGNNLSTLTVGSNTYTIKKYQAKKDGGLVINSNGDISLTDTVINKLNKTDSIVYVEKIDSAVGDNTISFIRIGNTDYKITPSSTNPGVSAFGGKTGAITLNNSDFKMNGNTLQLVSPISANPTETASADLTSLKIGSAIYKINSGVTYTSGFGIDLSNNKIKSTINNINNIEITHTNSQLSVQLNCNNYQGTTYINGNISNISKVFYGTTEPNPNLSATVGDLYIRYT